MTKRLVVSGCSYGTVYSDISQELKKLFGVDEIVNLSNLGGSPDRQMRVVIEWIAQNGNPDMVIMPVSYAYRFDLPIAEKLDPLHNKHYRCVWHMDIGKNIAPKPKPIDVKYQSALETYSGEAGLQLVGYQSTSGSPYTKTSDIVANADGTVASQMRLFTKASGDTSATERVRIQSDGKVGIGILSPQTKLHIAGPDSDGSAATLRIGGPSDGTGNNTSRLELAEAATNSNADMHYGFSFTAE